MRAPASFDFAGRAAALRGVLPAVIAVLVLMLALAPWSAAADQEAYYYPPIGSEEIFARSLTDDTSGATREVRIAFITQITKAQLAAPEAPEFVIFAKGGEAEHMIIVAIDDDIFSTLFRARAVLAQLTANARGTEFFIQNDIADRATWFDLARLLGFQDLVISDGETWAHRVVFE